MSKSNKLMHLKNIFLTSVLSLFVLPISADAAPSRYSVYATQGIDTNSASNSSVGAKIKFDTINDIDISVRPELDIKDSNIGVNLSLTIDKHLGNSVIYSGFGTGTNLISKDLLRPYAILGLEHRLSTYYLFGQTKLPFESTNNKYSPVFNIGLGYTI